MKYILIIALITSGCYVDRRVVYCTHGNDEVQQPLPCPMPDGSVQYGNTFVVPVNAWKYTLKFNVLDTSSITKRLMWQHRTQ